MGFSNVFTVRTVRKVMLQPDQNVISGRVTVMTLSFSPTVRPQKSIPNQSSN